MSKREPGRLRWRLSELLAEQGLIVSPYDLWTQEGGYRSWKWDLARWGGSGKWRDGIDPDGKPYGLQVSVCSWDTMTDCVRWGVTIGKFDGPLAMWGHVEVYRKEGIEVKV